MIIRKIHFGICRNVDDIKQSNCSAVVNDSTNGTLWRSKVSVLVVDDNDFPYATSLKAKGFRIQYERDIDPAIACDYDLILCDQYGVGKKMNSEAEGGSLARAIKSRYPLKYVVLYTSQTKMVGFDKGLKNLDDIVFAGMDDDDFEIKMDKWCRICINPVLQWKRLRSYLLDSGIGIHVVAELESEFVNQYRKTGTYSLPKKISYGDIALNRMITTVLTEFAKILLTKGVAAGVGAIAEAL